MTKKQRKTRKIAILVLVSILIIGWPIVITENIPSRTNQYITYTGIEEEFFPVLRSGMLEDKVVEIHDLKLEPTKYGKYEVKYNIVAEDYVDMPYGIQAKTEYNHKDWWWILTFSMGIYTFFAIIIILSMSLSLHYDVE